jgi:cbb3-type cytochrome oxidase subunit 3
VEDAKQQTEKYLKNVCMASYIRLGIYFIATFSFIIEITRRDFWYPIFGAFPPVLFDFLMIWQIVGLFGTFYIRKKKWVGFIIYTIYHLVHFILINFALYDIRMGNIIITFIIMVVFISLFVVALRRAGKEAAVSAAPSPAGETEEPSDTDKTE